MYDLIASFFRAKVVRHLSVFMFTVQLGKLCITVETLYQTRGAVKSNRTCIGGEFH
jgi:hypothetical protein